jgi:ParB family transcriptional regulator, chromosome partitioning protein
MSTQRRPPRAAKLKNVPVDRLERGRFQPRRVIDGVALGKLAESIRSEGMIQPLFVRKNGGTFEIVAGERRWHAAKIAGLKSVPTIVGKISDQMALAIALIENLHREDLNPIDQALAIQRLATEFGMTHQQVADTLGKSRAAVTNLLRLLELPEEVQEMVADGQLDNGHARALLALPREQCRGVAEKAARGQLSVRDVERLARQLPSEAQAEPGDAQTPPASSLGDELRALLRDRADIRPRKNGRWRLNVEFGDVDELRSALAAIDKALRDPRNA